MPRTWFDAHLDLAYLGVRGRDMLSERESLAGAALGPHPPAAVTIPALARANVRLVLGTIFTEPVPQGRNPMPEQYVSGDGRGARVRARAQLEAYRTWEEGGAIVLDLPRILRHDPMVGSIRAGMGVSSIEPEKPEARVRRALRDGRVHVGILMENADPVASPEDLAWWVSRGVCMIGLAWARGSRYAAGNATPREQDGGLTVLGRELVREMDRLGVIHDASHLSDRALADLFEATERRIVASHSNCRSLLTEDGTPGNQRHLSDDAVREIARRDGVIGLNLFSGFLAVGTGEEGRASIEQALSHVEHICHLTGTTRHVGLGSDADGGFSALRLPQGIDGPEGYAKLAEGLTRRGWSDEAVEDFAWRNWSRIW
jgi:membrane dipeptidase